MKILKKLLSYFFAFCILTGSMHSNIKATNDYQVHIAILCKDMEKGQEFIDLMCKEKSRLVFPSSSEFTGELNTDGKNTTVIYADDIDTNYHVKFHLLNNVDSSILGKCSGAIILYDISDPSLEPIVQSRTFYPSDIKSLINTKTPLVKYINKLQYSWPRFFSYIRGWYNAISFATYGKDQLPKEFYDIRHGKINRFTCETESYYGVDNKWNRGHPDLSTENVYKKTLNWISGQAYRSIGEGYIKGTYKPTTFSENINAEKLKLEDINIQDDIDSQDTFEVKKNSELECSMEDFWLDFSY